MTATVTEPRARRPGPLALLLALIAAVLVAGVTSLVVPGEGTRYQATSFVSLDEPRAVALARDGGILEKLSRVRLKYAGLVQTDTIAGPVAKRLNLPVEQVRGRLSVVVLPSDLLLRLSCTSGDAGFARRCADAASASVVAFVSQEQATAGIPPVLRLEASVVQPAGQAVTIGSHRKRVLAVSVLAGGLAGALVLALAARPRR